MAKLATIPRTLPPFDRGANKRPVNARAGKSFLVRRQRGFAPGRRGVAGLGVSLPLSSFVYNTPTQYEQTKNTGARLATL